MAKYQQYEDYKDSGVEWLDVIPNHWNTVSLKMLIDVRDGTHETPSYVEKSDNSYPLVTSKDVTSGQIDLTDCKYISQQDYESIIKRSAVSKGDILMPMIGTVGSPVLVEERLEIAIKNLALFRTSESNEKITVKFLYYFLNSKECSMQFSLEGRGGVQNFVSLGTLRSLGLPLITLNEQIQIANFLDHETAQIDTLIEKQQTLIKLLKEKRQAVISHAVTKGLNPDAPMKDSGVEWLGDVPEHWSIPQIGYHSKVTKLTGFEYTNLWRPNIEGTIIALRGFNIQERYLDLSKTERITAKLSNKLERSKLYEGDIVLPCTGTLGNAALIQENNLYHINQNIAKVTINSELFNPEFTVFWMTSLPFRQMIDFNNTSGMQPVLLIGDIRKLPIPLLPLDEQQEIVDFLLLKIEQFDRLIDNAEQAIQLMQERRTALISAAVTGKIDVREWAKPNF